MPSLRELQQGFVAAVLDADARPAIAVTPGRAAAERIAIYRRAIFANYRNALSASFPVVAGIVGRSTFDAAADAFVRVCPSTSGDLNVYGDAFPEFLAAYAPAAPWPHLADLARLEWAIDEASRAADVPRSPDAVIAALTAVAPECLPAVRLALDPSCRLVASCHPILRHWKRARRDGDHDAEVGEDAQAVLIRRDPQGVALEALALDAFAWLAALAADATLGEAIDAAQAANAAFDLGSMLAAHVGAGTIVAVR